MRAAHLHAAKDARRLTGRLRAQGLSSAEIVPHIRELLGELGVLEWLDQRLELGHRDAPTP